MFKLFVLTLSLLLQVLSSQCFCNDNHPTWAATVQASPSWTGVQQPYTNSLPYYPQEQYGLDIASLSSTNHGFSVISSSPIEPGTVSIKSDNVIEGPISVYGQLPFLSAVSFEGSFPTSGYGGVAYGCGNGNVAILSESISEGYEMGPGQADFNVLPARLGMEIPSIRSAVEIPSIRSAMEIPCGRPGIGFSYGRPGLGNGIRSGFSQSYY